ncbi:RidA family protein [Natronobiforma cellulositropha]|uniref:RidA family protein n=1 Tax=Natronobiforma cellulositropha TaxID=1679076 RepID=UPI0021D5CAE0|nr:RidA family protein [Natronobiforma cellulositropha]
MSTATRKQRDGAKYIGAFGRKTGDSDLLFVEGQLPESNGEVQNHASPAEQMSLCLDGLETELTEHGSALTDVLQVTLYVSDMDSYREMNDTYETYFPTESPARTTVGVCSLLEGASVTLDAVVAIE